MPSDTGQGTLNQIENRAHAKGVEIWKHPIEGKDATEIALDVIAAIDER